MEIKRKCVGCFEEINPLRIKALPNTKTCVNCSTTGAKKAISTQFGEKDDTWNDVVFVEDDEFEKYEKTKTSKVQFDEIDEEDEEE